MYSQKKGKRAFVPVTPDFHQQNRRKPLRHTPIQLVALVIIMLMFLLFIVFG